MQRRIEIKRIIKKLSTSALLSSLSQNGFYKTNDYNVFSLYFDDTDLTSYNDHINGAMKRSKFRLRAYGNKSGTISKNIFFETKSKDGNFGSKVRSLLTEPMNIPIIQKDDCLTLLLEYASSEDLYQLQNHWLTHRQFPTFFITYNRQRFGNMRSQTEFNLDSDITAIPISRLMRYHKSITSNFQVLEEKYKIFDAENRTVINKINHISYPTAFSKYIWAIENSPHS